MSKISLEPNASGAGTFTLAAPNSNTNRTLTLPDESGAIFSDGTGVPGSAVTGQLASSNMPAGSVIQVVSTTKTDTFSVTTSSFVEVPGLTATITPHSTSSNILVLASLTRSGGEEGFITEGWSFYRDSTRLGPSNSFGISYEEGSSADFTENASGQFLDSPNTTSSIKYAIRVMTDNANRPLYVNRSENRSQTAFSTITLMEIAG